MKIFRWASLLIATALVLSACSGSYASDGSGDLDTTSAAYQQATERVTQFTDPQNLQIPIDTPVQPPGEPLTIAYTQCVATVCTEISDQASRAAQAIGATYTPLFHQDTPETVQAAFQQAIQMKVDILLISGNPLEWYASQLEELKSAGTTVVGWSLPGGYRVDNIAANLISGDDYYLNGTLMADYALTNADGTPNILFVNTPSFPVLATLGQGLTAEVTNVCPRCKLTTVDVTVDDIVNGSTTSAVVAALQRNPGINYIVAGFGGLLTQQTIQSIRSAGFSNIPTVSQAGTQSNYDMIRVGDQTADLAIPSGLVGWRAIDAALRVRATGEPGTYQPPFQLDLPGHPDALFGGITQLFITKDTAPQESPFNSVPGYHQAYSKVWGIQ